MDPGILILKLNFYEFVGKIKAIYRNRFHLYFDKMLRKILRY
jgi:hypothetical protein